MLFPSPFPRLLFQSTLIAPHLVLHLSILHPPHLCHPKTSPLHSIPLLVSSPLCCNKNTAQDSLYFCILCFGSHCISAFAVVWPFTWATLTPLFLLLFSFHLLLCPYLHFLSLLLFYFYLSVFAPLSLLTVTIGLLRSFHVSPRFSCAALSHSSAWVHHCRL